MYDKAHMLGRVDLVIIDECHLVPRRGNGMYLRFLKEMRVISPHVKVIGMTATPYRLDSGLLTSGENRIFTEAAYTADIGELVAEGYLCPLVSKQGAARADTSHIRVRYGEFVEADLAAAMDTEILVRGAVDETLELCRCRNKWLIFCTSVEHAHHVRDEVASRGIQCGLVTGETTAYDRSRTLDDFRGGSLRAVVNVNVLTTGFDAPDIDAIVMLRPTLSTGLYVQMLGRGMRPHPSKNNTLVLDFAGNVMRHGPIDCISVKGEKKTENGQAPMKPCPSCKSIVHISRRECPDCGFIFAVEDRGAAKHSTRASTAPVMQCIARKPEQIEVDSIEYEIHKKRGSPNSLKVIYNCGLMQYCEWICLEHDGYARRKACDWWATRSNEPPPATVAEAILASGTLRKPNAITVDFSKRYPSVTRCTFKNNGV